MLTQIAGEFLGSISHQTTASQTSPGSLSLPLSPQAKQELDISGSPSPAADNRYPAPHLHPKAPVYFIKETDSLPVALLVPLKVFSPIPYLQRFLIQHSVLALNLVSWPFLFSWVFCTSKN